MANDPALLSLSAIAIRDRLLTGDVTPHDLLDTLEARIAAVDGPVNALPTLCFDRAHAHADALMKKPVAERGLLAGIPVPIKDLTDVAGVRSTQGSPIFADTIPKASGILVENLERAGGIVYAKSNTPEFGAGANTFNEVFGATRNPYDTRMSAAGSSGGAAVALATGTAWLAHGSDLGGSLRNPASFCGIVGMRPTPGRVASNPFNDLERRLPAQGPMARTVLDCALLLDAMSGEDVRDPVSMPRPAVPFLDAARSGWKPRRVAYSPDFGITPVDPEVAAITRAAALRFAEAGVIVEEASPDFSGAHEAFHILRAKLFAMSKVGLLRQHRDKLKPEVIWNIEEGLKLSIEDLARAEAIRAELTRRYIAFFDTYDLLLSPATIVAPFPVGNRYVAECDGHTFGNYVEWLAIAYATTLVGAPCLSLPAGLTKAGLPIGLQVAALPRADGRVLAGAALLESILDLKTHRIVDPLIRH